MTVHYPSRRIPFFVFPFLFHLDSYTSPVFALFYHQSFSGDPLILAFFSLPHLATLMQAVLDFVIWSLAHTKRSGGFNLFGCLDLLGSRFAGY